MWLQSTGSRELLVKEQGELDIVYVQQVTPLVCCENKNIDQCSFNFKQSVISHRTLRGLTETISLACGLCESKFI